MKCVRMSFEVNVEKYEVGQGMEDGFELWTDVVTRGWFVTDSLIQVKKDRRGKTFIGEGDYIITEADGSRHVCCGEKVFDRFKPVEE